MSKNGIRICASFASAMSVLSAGLWLLAAQAQRFGIDPHQAAAASIWNKSAADWNYYAAIATAVAAFFGGLALSSDPEEGHQLFAWPAEHTGQVRGLAGSQAAANVCACASRARIRPPRQGSLVKRRCVGPRRRK